MAIQIIASHVEEPTGSSHTTQENYGPLNLVQGVKVTKIELSGSVSFDAIGTFGDTSATYFADATVIACQYGATGFTPLSVVSAGGLENTSMPIGEKTPPAAAIAAWAPSTDTAAVADRYPFHYRKFLQLVVPTGGLDFYVSVGPTYTITQGFRSWFTFRIWYVN